jgi:hypothetical protein
MRASSPSASIKNESAVKKSGAFQIINEVVKEK